MSRRLLSLSVAAAIIGAPAIVLGVSCVGNSCSSSAAPTARVPFCPLPSDLRSLIAAGFYEGRSPDVFAVPTSAYSGGTDSADAGVAWPQASPSPVTGVPVGLFGDGISRTSLPAGVGLDQIAPLLSNALGYKRPHPNIRAGKPIAGVARAARPRLVVEIAWSGVGTETLKAERGSWPALRSLVRGGAWTVDGTTGSVPVDPAATLATYGTGALPSQHGITGAVLRNTSGEITTAWSGSAPRSVLATLADDYQHSREGEPMVGLVEASPVDQGLIGGNWYIGERGASIVDAPRDPVDAFESLLRRGFGGDSTADILGVVLKGTVGRMDSETGAIVAAARAASGGDATFAFAGTGATQRERSANPRELADSVESSIRRGSGLIAATEPGGFFIDQTVLTKLGVSSGVVVQALDAMKNEEGEPEFTDSFQGFSIAFRRYCP